MTLWEINMKKTILHASAMLLISLSVASMPALATDIVYDPWNHSETLKSAIMSVKNEINTWTSAYQSVRQTIELIKSTATLDGIAKIAGLQDELKMYRDLKATDEQLRDVFNQSRAVYQDLQSQFGAGRVSWKQFMEGKAAVNLYHTSNLMKKIETVNDSMEKLNNRRQEMLDKAQNATGATSAAQALSVQTDAIIEQNNQTIALLKAGLANQAKQIEDKQKEDEVVDAARKARQDRMKSAVENFQ